MNSVVGPVNKQCFLSPAQFNHVILLFTRRGKKISSKNAKRQRHIITNNFYYASDIKDHINENRGAKVNDSYIDL